MIEVNGSGDYELVDFPDDRRRIDIGDFYGDYRKIRSKLGWRPMVGLRDGLTRTLELLPRQLDRILYSRHAQALCPYLA